MGRKMPYFEKMKLIKELSQLRKEERKFSLAFADESNNAKMDDFCMRGLTKIRDRINEINSMI